MTLPWSSEFPQEDGKWEKVVVRGREAGQTRNLGAATDHFVVFPKTSRTNISETNICHLAVVTALTQREGMLLWVAMLGTLCTISLSSQDHVRHISMKLDKEKTAPGTLGLPFCWRRQKAACVCLVGRGPLGKVAGATSRPPPPSRRGGGLVTLDCILATTLSLRFLLFPLGKSIL